VPEAGLGPVKARLESRDADAESAGALAVAQAQAEAERHDLAVFLGQLLDGAADGLAQGL
jgi:hypothetical protein